MGEIERITIHDIHRSEKTAERDHHEKMISYRTNTLIQIYKKIENNKEVFYESGSGKISAPMVSRETLEYDYDFYNEDLKAHGFQLIAEYNSHQANYPIKTLSTYSITPYVPEVVKETKYKRGLSFMNKIMDFLENF